MAVIALAAQSYRHWTFRSTTYDLAVFEQAVWKLSRGRSPEVSLVGWNVFADHLSPVLLGFAPLYRLAATPLWFFVAQAVAAGLAVAALRPALDELGLPRRRHWPVVIAFVASPLLWNAVLFDFHPTTLAVPLLTVGLVAAWRNDGRVLLAVSAGLILLRDDLGLLVAVLALLGARRRWWLAAAGLGWVVVGSVVGEVLGADRHWDYRYGYLGDSAVDAAAAPIRSAIRVAQQLATGDDGWLVLTWLVGFAFLPLLAPGRLVPAALVALPLLAATDPNLHSAAFHYGAPALPFLVVAAAAGFKRVPERWAFPHGAALCGALAVSAGLALGPATTRSLTWNTFSVGDARRALRSVPAHAGVVAPSFLGAHLAHRDLLLPLPYPFSAASRNFPLAPDVVQVSAARQAEIDAVVLAPSPLPGESSLIEDFLEAPPKGFNRRDYGEVVVLRRAGRA